MTRWKTCDTMARPLCLGRRLTMSFVLPIALLCFVTTGAFAGTGSGTVSAPHFMSNGGVIVYLLAARDGVPLCAATQPYRFAVNAATAEGKAQLAGLLTAFATGKTVSVIGTGNCAVYNDTETISYFSVSD